MRIRLPFLLFAVLVALTASGKPRLIEVRLTRAGFAKVFPEGEIAIPRVRVYDADGGEVFEMTGFGPDLLEMIDASLVRTAPAKARKLGELIPLVTTPEHKPVTAADLPKNERVIVTFGAEWCGPCRYLKAELMKKDDLTVIEVDADTRKGFEQQP
jgi:hypothetical protein